MTTIAPTRTSRPDSSTDAAPQKGITPRRASLIAGVGYAVLFALALFANFFVRESLIVTDDAAATAANVVGSTALFRWGLVSFLAIFLLDVVVAWALYIVFRNANRDLSLLTAWFRIVYTVFLGVAIAYFFQALQLLGGAGFLTAFDPAQLHAQALVALDTFNSMWLIGLAGFGVHVILLGYLVIRSGYASRALGFVLMAAGLAYIVDTVGRSLLANYNDYEGVFLAVVAAPAILAEGWFGLWLLLRGGKTATDHVTVH